MIDLGASLHSPEATKMRTDLLLQLAAALERPMPAEFHFDMREWLCPRYYVRDQPCGFAGCAIGLGSTLPGWERLSFDIARQPLIEIDGKSLRNFEAVAAYLEIDCEAAYRLFSPQYYPEATHPLDVAHRIRRFVADPGVIEQIDDVAALIEQTEDVAT
jgi:hypothetical protein